MTKQGRKRGLSDLARTRAVEIAKQSMEFKGPANWADERRRRNQSFLELDDYQKMVAMQQISEGLDLEIPYFRTHEGHAKTISVIDGQEYLNFSSYDYLGLNADARPARAAREAIEKYGVSASASRMVAGDRPIHNSLENSLADHYGAAAAQVFVSGHGTNVSVISALVGDGDLVIYDAFVHNSVSAGVQKSGASRRSFAHNDLLALERVLTQSRSCYRNILVVVEGLYSMDGDVPDLPGLLALKDRFNFWLMIDEAHALGCVGETGQGSFEHFGVNPNDVDIWMGTLSKTLSSTGGYVAGSSELINFLRYHADGFVFSVALPPAMAAAANCALAIMQAEPQRVAKLHANAKFFLRVARDLGLNTGQAQPGGVMPVIVGDSLKAIKLSEELFKQGVNVAPAVFPGVPQNTARLRFFLSADHTNQQMEQALMATKANLEKLINEKFGEALTEAFRRNAGKV